MTDEIILALVKRHGFKLPEGLYPEAIELDGRVFWNTEKPVGQVHDLCAMEFARQAWPRRARIRLAKFSDAMQRLARGDSEAALKALYDAMEAK